MQPGSGQRFSGVYSKLVNQLSRTSDSLIVVRTVGNAFSSVLVDSVVCF